VRPGSTVSHRIQWSSRDRRGCGEAGSAPRRARAFFFTTTGDENWSLVMLQLAEVDVSHLAELMTGAWRMRGPKELTADLGLEGITGPEGFPFDVILAGPVAVSSTGARRDDPSVAPENPSELAGGALDK
jgi:hypothetical protein